MPHDHHGHVHGAAARRAAGATHHAHDHGHPHGPGHNHAADHLASHMHATDEAAELKVLAAQFIDGFRQAADKIAYLRLAGVPFELADDGATESEGPRPLKLVDIRLSTEWQVGTASPGFGSRALSYLPLTGEMVAERVNMAFVYVSLSARRDVDLREFLARRHADPSSTGGR